MKMELRSRAVDKMHKRRDRYEIPEWQRGEVWPTDKKQLLIDSILRGWHLPKFYFVKTSDAPEAWEVVDGQQRLATIWEFLDDKLPLSPDSSARFSGATLYSTLPPDVSDSFDDFEMDYEEITDADEDEIRDYFQRLQNGLPLTSAERLNATPGHLTDFVRGLVSHGFFDRLVFRDYRHAYFDVCLKVIAIEIEGIRTRLRIQELEELLRTHQGFSPDSDVAKRIKASLDFLAAEVFTGASPILRNRTIVQSLITLTASLLREGPLPGKGHQLRRFFDNFVRDVAREVEKGHQASDTGLLEFQSTISANAVTGAETRQKILVQRLLLFDPTFVGAISPGTIAQSGLGADINQRAQRISEKVFLVNKNYAGTHGGDLFKPTNETTQAQASLGTPIRDLGSYGRFIDSVYFLFFEGAAEGQRYGTTLPQVVDDIRSLRTQLRHDVDHGKAAKVRKQRKSLGDTFQRYGGVSTPDILQPEGFLVVQASLLEQIEAMLDSLLPV